MVYSFKVAREDAGRSIYRYLRRALAPIPRNRLEQLFRNRDVKLNNRRVRDKWIILAENDHIIVYGFTKVLSNESTIDTTNSLLPHLRFSILYEDANILVVDKPAGLIVHGTKDSLDAQVREYLVLSASQENIVYIPSHIGRLDQSVSGIMVYAKNYQTLSQLLSHRDYIYREYMLRSAWRGEVELVEIWIHRDKRDNIMRIAETGHGQLARTLIYRDTQGRIIARLLTGRRHQIRLTMAHLGRPIYGDTRYGGSYGRRLFLHSYRIMFYNLDANLEYLNGLVITSNTR